MGARGGWGLRCVNSPHALGIGAGLETDLHASPRWPRIGFD